MKSYLVLSALLVKCCAAPLPVISYAVAAARERVLALGSPAISTGTEMESDAPQVFDYTWPIDQEEGAHDKKKH